MKKILSNGPLLIVIAACLWALDGIVRRSLYTLPPIIIVYYEHLIGFVILTPFAYKTIMKTKFTKKELIPIAFVALLSGLLGTLWFTDALSRIHFIPFSVVFLLQKLQPLFALSTAHFFLKEKLNKNYIQWAVLALISAYFVTFPNGYVNWETGKETIIAAGLALGAAFAWGTTTTFSKMALQNKPDVAISWLRFAMTTVMAFIAVFLFKQSSALFSPSFSQFVRFFIIALSTGMIALSIYYKGLKLTEVKVSTILELMFPFLAVIIDVVAYKTVLAPTQYLAAIVLLFSIYKVSQLNSKKVEPSPAEGLH